MNTLNKRRSGDENIGKLIVFAITIVIAIGLVGLVSYFYTQSREAAIVSGVLGSTASSAADIQKVPGLSSACAGSPKISYDAIGNVYTVLGATSDSACETAIRGLKGVGTPASGSGYTLAK